MPIDWNKVNQYGTTPSLSLGVNPLGDTSLNTSGLFNPQYTNINNLDFDNVPIDGLLLAESPLFTVPHDPDCLTGLHISQHSHWWK